MSHFAKQTKELSRSNPFSIHLYLYSFEFEVTVKWYWMEQIKQEQLLCVIDVSIWNRPAK